MVVPPGVDSREAEADIPQKGHLVRLVHHQEVLAAVALVAHQEVAGLVHPALHQVTLAVAGVEWAAAEEVALPPVDPYMPPDLEIQVRAPDIDAVHAAELQRKECHT